MGKVKQAIQEVEEEVVSLVKDGLSLSGIKLILGYEKYNPYMTNKDLEGVKWEKSNKPYKKSKKKSYLW